MPVLVDPTANALGGSGQTWQFVPDRDFDLFVLSGEYHWGLGTTDVLGPDGQALDMARQMDTLIEQYGRQYGDLIAVGTASCEGDIEEENDRAEKRADHLVTLLRSALGRLRDGREIHALSLGKFHDCSGHRNTVNQRRILLAAEKTRSCPADLRDRLYQLFQRRRPSGFTPDDYSSFELDHEHRSGG